MEIAALIIGMIAKAAELGAEALIASRQRTEEIAKELHRVLDDTKLAIDAMMSMLATNDAAADAAADTKP